MNRRPSHPTRCLPTYAFPFPILRPPTWCGHAPHGVVDPVAVQGVGLTALNLGHLRGQDPEGEQEEWRGFTCVTDRLR